MAALLRCDQCKSTSTDTNAISSLTLWEGWWTEVSLHKANGHWGKYHFCSPDCITKWVAQGMAEKIKTADKGVVS